MEHDALDKVVELYPDNIELSRNAKGEPSWTIKVRFKGDEPIEDRVKKVQDIDSLMKKALRP